jgi:hypothetical protein
MRANSRILLVCTRVLLVFYSYVLIFYSYLLVCYSCVTRMYLPLVCYYVLVCYSYVLVWCFSHDLCEHEYINICPRNYRYSGASDNGQVENRTRDLSFTKEILLKLRNFLSII